MAFDDVWAVLREAVADLPDDAVLVTPVTDRQFAVVENREDRLVVRFLDGDAERTLWRDQFAVLYERIDQLPDGIPLADLQFGAEPYLAVLSLHPEYGVDEEAQAFDRLDGPSDAGRFVAGSDDGAVEPATLATDALLLADALERHDADDPDGLTTDALVDLYVMLSEVQREANRVRRRVSDALLDRFDTDRPVVAQYGAVQRTTRQRRQVKDDEAVFDALDDHDVPREWVLGVVPDRLDVVLAVTDLQEEAVYDLETETYLRKADVSETAKSGRLAGLRARLADAGTEEADALQREVDDLEGRIDDLLADE